MDYLEVKNSVEYNFLKDAGDLRKSICEAVQLINSDCAFKIKSEDLPTKTALWHKMLKAIKDEQIVKATYKWLESGEKNFPTVQQFKELCISGQRSTVQDADFIPIHDNVLNNKNLKSILEKLKKGGTI